MHTCCGCQGRGASIASAGSCGFGRKTFSYSYKQYTRGSQVVQPISRRNKNTAYCTAASAYLRVLSHAALGSNTQQLSANTVQYRNTPQPCVRDIYQSAVSRRTSCYARPIGLQRPRPIHQLLLLLLLQRMEIPSSRPGSWCCALAEHSKGTERESATVQRREERN